MHFKPPDQVRRPTFASGKTKPVMERRKDGDMRKTEGDIKGGYCSVSGDKKEWS
jgi:hypothetical protein